MSTPHPPLPDSYEGLYARAQALARRGNVDESIPLYRRLTDKLGRLSDSILDRRPDLRDLHRQARLELASLLEAEGRYAEAIEVEQVLLRTDADDAARWRRNLAVLRAAKGEVDAGLAELQALADEAPAQPEGWMLLGQEARIAGEFGQSQRALNRALAACEATETATLAEVHYQRFLLFKEMKRLDDALAAWEEAVKHNPDFSQTVREVYTVLTDVGRFSDAQRYVKRDSNALQSGFQQGLIASLTGKPIDAREAWRQVASLDPDDFEYGHDAWVEAVLRLGDPDPALEWLQESLVRFGTPRLLVLSGIGWAMRDDRELASVLFQQAINLLRRARPPKQKLDSADWRLLESLVTDGELKTALKTYFAVVETLW